MKPFIICAMLFLSFACAAQKAKQPLKIDAGSSLLYYVENNSGNNQFLIPYVEAELKALNYNGYTRRQPLFKDVNSLNLYISGDNATKALIRAITAFTKTYSPPRNNF